MDTVTLRSGASAEPRVAIIHHWLVTMRGGERVLECLCEMFPGAEIFTHVYDPERVSESIRRRKIHTSFIQKLPFSTRLYQRYLPLMPLALESFDLRDFDLVISNDSGPVKGVLTFANAVHICYCLTPMRYIWGMQDEYTASSGWLVRWIFALITHYMRLWDYAAAARVDEFIGISRVVSQRIWKCYRREAPIIWPPVECDAFRRSEAISEFYLVAGQLVSYKRADLAVEACNRLGRKLVVIGGGAQLKRIKKLAGPTVSVIGPQPFEVLRDHYARCRALIFPGEEDFGLVPVEAMASGRPVIALRRGGALDTVVENKTGVFFNSPTVSDLVEAVIRFEAIEETFDPEGIIEHARQFERSRFEDRFRAFVDACLKKHGKH